MVRKIINTVFRPDVRGHLGHVSHILIFFQELVVFIAEVRVLYEGLLQVNESGGGQVPRSTEFAVNVLLLRQMHDVSSGIVASGCAVEKGVQAGL